MFSEIRKLVSFYYLSKAALQHCLTTLERQSDVASISDRHYVAVSWVINWLNCIVPDRNIVVNGCFLLHGTVLKDVYVNISTALNKRFGASLAVLVSRDLQFSPTLISRSKSIAYWQLRTSVHANLSINYTFKIVTLEFKKLQNVCKFL